MNLVLQSSERALISLSKSELVGLRTAVNEICKHDSMSNIEFETRFGLSRAYFTNIYNMLCSKPHPELQLVERTDAWPDAGSVQVICISSSGDPVDMGIEEAREFVRLLQSAISEAE